MQESWNTLIRNTVFLSALAFSVEASLATPPNQIEGAPIDQTKVQNILETCFSPEEACDEKLIGFINSATRQMDIAIYALTHAHITESILSAHARGVEIRVVVDATQSHSKHSKVTHLSKAGIPVRFGQTQSYRGIMHNKFTIIDNRRVQTGSFNYTSNASQHNFENQIYLSDPTTVMKFKKAFEKIWADGVL